MSIRSFSTSAAACGRVGCNIVKPVHHTVRFKKSQLSTRFPNLLKANSDITNPKFKPTRWGADRLHSYHQNVLASDLLLMNYKHKQGVIPGSKLVPRAGNTPYEIYQPAKQPFGGRQLTKDVKPADWTNVPFLKSVKINCYAREAAGNNDLAVVSKVILQQITGAKVYDIYAKSNLPRLHVRPGMTMGAKTTLKGQTMHEFITTLTEIILPRSKTFKGISESAGDQSANLGFTLSKEDVRSFPEIENNLEYWPQTFFLEIVFECESPNKEASQALLSGLGFPFRNKKAPVAE